MLLEWGVHYAHAFYITVKKTKNLNFLKVHNELEKNHEIWDLHTPFHGEIAI